jgi:hypothetical protein
LEPMRLKFGRNKGEKHRWDSSVVGGKEGIV